MFYKTKDGSPFFIKKRNIERGQVYLKAMNFNFDEIGYLRYEITDDKAYLYNIRVEEAFLNKGVGHFLIQKFEEEMEKDDVFKVKGKYYPDGPGGSLTEDFYKREGYTVESGDGLGDWVVYKYFYREKSAEKNDVSRTL